MTPADRPAWWAFMVLVLALSLLVRGMKRLQDGGLRLIGVALLLWVVGVFLVGYAVMRGDV